MSDSEYRRVLAQWATGILPAELHPVEILDVSMPFDKGWGGSDVTAGEDADLTVIVKYRDSAGLEGSCMTHDTEKAALTVSSLLSQLFKIADPT